MRKQLKLSLLFSLLLSLAASGARAGELGAMLKNNDGVRKFQDKKPLEAFDRFNGALAEEPFSPEVHFNIGTTFLENKEFDKALSEYQQAIERSKGNSSRRARDARFRSYFNMGIALSELKKTDMALEAYQSALEEYPDSKEAKTNIELLTAQGTGSGEGDDKDKKDDKQDKGKPKDDKGKDKGKDKDDKPKPPDQPKEPEKKPTPRPFKSEDLSQQNVGKILEELKRQEEQIRARMQNENVKDAPPDKDW